jgi:hypothetical protein
MWKLSREKKNWRREDVRYTLPPQTKTKEIRQARHSMNLKKQSLHIWGELGFLGRAMHQGVTPPKILCDTSQTTDSLMKG